MIYAALTAAWLRAYRNQEARVCITTDTGSDDYVVVCSSLSANIRTQARRLDDAIRTAAVAVSAATATQHAPEIQQLRVTLGRVL